MDKFLKNTVKSPTPGTSSEHCSSEDPGKKYKRTYDPDFLKYGFTYTAKHGEHKPLCVLCNEVLANESMKPSKLQRHLQTKHASHKDKPLAFFQGKSQNLEASQKTFQRACTVQEQALRASYLVSYRIAKSKKAHTLAEEVILPCAIDMCTALIGEKEAAKLKTIPLSNDTVHRRICDMSNDVEHQLTERLSSDCFALQLDESTDVANRAILLVYVRYVWNNDFEEHFLFSADLPTSTTAVEIFAAMDAYLNSVGLCWSNCVGVTTDGAASMTGRHSGVVKRILDVAAPNATWNHCFLHREALAAKDMVPEIHETLREVVKVVNYIKHSAKNARCFQAFCQEMGSGHEQLLYHAEVRWLSRGKVLSRVYELRNELAAFLAEKKSELAEHFNDDLWIARLSYLADIFDHLNTLNVSLQGKGHNRFEQMDKINAFKKKLSLWSKHVTSDRLDMLPNVCHEVKNLMDTDRSELKSVMRSHLEKLQTGFSDYFPEEENALAHVWIRDPFGTDVETVTMSSEEESQLVDLSCDHGLQKKFLESSLPQFWCSVVHEYPALGHHAIRVLLPFSTTYLCEAGFSALTQLKNKNRNKLNVEHDLRIALSSITPNVDRLMKGRQAQISH